MWIEEGFAPAEFWEQTGWSYQVAMEARHRALKAQMRESLLQAWQIGNFSGAAFAGKLRDFRHYVRDDEPDVSRGGAALLSEMKALQAKGVPIKIERIDRAAVAGKG